MKPGVEESGRRKLLYLFQVSPLTPDPRGIFYLRYSNNMGFTVQNTKGKDGDWKRELIFVEGEWGKDTFIAGEERSVPTQFVGRRTGISGTLGLFQRSLERSSKGLRTKTIILYTVVVTTSTSIGRTLSSRCFQTSDIPPTVLDAPCSRDTLLLTPPRSLKLMELYFVEDCFCFRHRPSWQAYTRQGQGDLEGHQGLASLSLTPASKVVAKGSFYVSKKELCLSERMRAEAKAQLK
ncbi:hypothetical protein QYF36_004001 [Acer negundo]|nr:hypothetical protein QYF36_004001 [Acer negundo]